MSELGTESLLARTDETDGLVACWRFEQFMILGFEEEVAFDLASSTADLHQTRRLISTGCPMDIARDIVL